MITELVLGSIRIAFLGAVETVETIDREFQADLAVPGTFDVTKVTDEQVEHMMRQEHQDGEKEPCSLCMLEALTGGE